MSFCIDGVVLEEENGALFLRETLLCDYCDCRCVLTYRLTDCRREGDEE